MLHLVRGITNLRAKHPALANRELGDVPSDTQDWSVFERVDGPQRYLVLINPTAGGKDYAFHESWFPRYMGRSSYSGATANSASGPTKHPTTRTSTEQFLSRRLVW
jgi:hypothetical protein